MTWDREAAVWLIERAKGEPWSLPLETRLQLMLQDAIAEVDRLTATIAAADGVLDAAKVGPCSTLGSRVEMLVQERDSLRDAKRAMALIVGSATAYARAKNDGCDSGREHANLIELTWKYIAEHDA